MSIVERLEDRLYGLADDASSTSRRLSRSSRTKRSKEVEALACILALLPQVAVHGWILISKGAINLTTELLAAVIGIFLSAVLVGVGQISLSGHRRLPLVLALAHTIGLVTSSAAVGPNASLLICGITAIADVYDALRSARPYKEPFSVEKSVELIQEGAGTHFDPEMVQAFMKAHPAIERIISDFKDPEVEAEDAA